VLYCTVLDPIFRNGCCLSTTKVMATMIVNNYHCRNIDAHYMSEKRQAVAYLFATGAKALVIMAQRAKHINNNCNDIYNDVFHGPNTEAKLKIEIINEEKIRNIKRKICENKPIEVIKYSRKGQTRNILLKIKHNKSQILFVWKSKSMLGLKFKKNFSVDKNKHIEKWMLTSNDDDGDNSYNEDYNHENDDYNNDPGNNDQNKYRDDIDNDKTSNDILSLSPMVSDTKNMDNNSINRNNQYKHQQQHHQHHHQQQYSNCINDDNMILPFLRFENNKRILDIQFMDFCEMKACLELIVNNPSVTVRTSVMN